MKLFTKRSSARRCTQLLGLIAALLLAGLVVERPRAQPAAAPAPKLIVIVVIDQMRFEYLDRFASLWSGGLQRLRSEAAVFDRAFYPYLATVTCAGHATIATGTYPSRHGVIMNEWWQRGAQRRMSCTDDPSVKSVPYRDPPERIGHSAHRLRVPTLADRLRAASPASRVVTLSMKPRSAVMLAGHGGTAVTWVADTNVLATSTAYSPRPVREVQEFIAANPVERDRGKVWERLFDASRYTGDDKGAAERAPRGWTSTFPHPLNGAAGTAPEVFYDLWERSPFSDDYLAAMAAGLVRSLQLGQRDAIDYLGVSFSALDYVGHDFGPNSHEVQDTLARLDRSLGQLLATLDAAVGRDRYVVGLSADHGVSEIPEAAGGGGRVLNAQVRRAAEDAMTAAYGGGPHIAHVEYTNLYLTEATRKRAAGDPNMLRPLIAAVSKIEGVQRVLPSAELESKQASSDPLERAAALSHFPAESGDVVIVLSPGWIGTDTAAATHGSMQPYDQHVPVIVMGAGIKPGRYGEPASPADLAPTLASLARLPLPGVEGRVLREAIK